MCLQDRLTPSTRIVAWRLTEGRVVSAREIADALYSGQVNPKAEWQMDCARLYAWRARRFLASRGIAVDNYPRVGWQVNDVEGLREVLSEEIRRNT